MESLREAFINHENKEEKKNPILRHPHTRRAAMAGQPPSLSFPVLFFTLCLLLLLGSPGEARRSPKPEPKPQPSIYVPWLNQYRQRFYHQCPHGEILSSALSFFNQDEGRDRLWSYGCRRPPSWLGPVTECFWEDYNRAGQQWSQRCSGNGIVAGVQSNYFEAVLDREWQFYCCKFRDTCPTSCWMTTDYPSYLTEEMEFYLDHGYYIHGAQSTFGPVKRDRQWKFILCQMSAVACVKP